jgi:hypothetical protein
MKNFLKGRNLVIGIITLIIGVVAVVGITRVWAAQETTVSGNVASFILNPEGKIDGAVLSTGDQVKFGRQTGELVAAQVKIGDALSATGHAGSSSAYGRELRAESLQIGDQTITVVDAKPRPGDRDGKKGPRPPKGERPRPPRDGKPEPRDGERPEPRDEQMSEPPAPNAENKPEANLPPAPEKETAKTNSTVKFILVGGKGEARGLILADGTQINLPKEVKDAGISFSEATSVNVEGEISKGQYGNFIRPTVLTIDNQTFSFNR